MNSCRIANKEFEIGYGFRHPLGGTWKVVSINEDNTITIEPTFGTKIKPQIIGRVFKVQGVWFKVITQGQNFITLHHDTAQ